MRIASPIPICCVRLSHKACSISYASEARAQTHLLLVVLLTFLNMKQDLSLTCEFWNSMGECLESQNRPAKQDDFFSTGVNTFHGRGFFPGGITLDDPLTVIAAIEAFLGLIIEVTFIATLTQRFFGK
jgi:hypothetical protein